MDVVGERTLRDVIEERAAATPDRTFLVFETADGAVEEYSYGRFLEVVDRAAGGFASLGIGRGDTVVIHLPNCPEFLVSWFGLVWIGAVAVPSNVANTAAELDHVVGLSEAKAVVTTAEHMPLFDDLPAGGSLRWRIRARGGDGPGTLSGLLAEGRRAPVDLGPRPEDVAELIFTSGTTSRPKAVMLTHVNCLRSGEQAWRSIAADERDRFLTALPAFHVNAQSFTVFAALCVGGTAILLEQYRASQFVARLREHRATVVGLVAMQLRTLLAQPAGPGDRDHAVRRTIYALNVSDDERERFESRFGFHLLNGYGLSEAMTMVTVSPLYGPRRWPSIGLPVLDRTVRLVDETGTDVPVGEPGELIVRGEPGRTIMKGYFRDATATADAIRDGWLHTGDHAYRDEAGYLFFFDRKKDVIKRAGENISALEVEAAVLEHPDVLEAAVIGVPDPVRDEAVKAFVVVRPGTAPTPEGIVTHCRARLAGFKVPTEVEFLDRLPKTSIGKIEKKALRGAPAGSGR